MLSVTLGHFLHHHRASLVFHPIGNRFRRMRNQHSFGAPWSVFPASPAKPPCLAAVRLISKSESA